MQCFKEKNYIDTNEWVEMLGGIYILYNSNIFRTTRNKLLSDRKL